GRAPPPQRLPADGPAARGGPAPVDPAPSRRLSTLLPPVGGGQARGAQGAARGGDRRDRLLARLPSRLSGLGVPRRRAPAPLGRGARLPSGSLDGAHAADRRHPPAGGARGGRPACARLRPAGDVLAGRVARPPHPSERGACLFSSKRFEEAAMLEKRVPQRRRDAASLTVSESVGHAAVEALVS